LCTITNTFETVIQWGANLVPSFTPNIELVSTTTSTFTITISSPTQVILNAFPEISVPPTAPTGGAPPFFAFYFQIPYSELVIPIHRAANFIIYGITYYTLLWI
jgi:hypothetical protein